MLFNNAVTLLKWALKLLRKVVPSPRLIPATANTLNFKCRFFHTPRLISASSLTVTDDSPAEPPAWFNAAVHQLREDIRALKGDLKRYVEPKATEQFFQTMILLENTEQKTNNIIMENSQIANLPIESRQSIGRIDQRIGPLQNEPEAKTLADSLAQITKAVAESSHFASEHDRQDVLDGIETLLTRAAQPKAERKRGVFKPIIEPVAGICDAAGGLTAVWEAAGPTVMRFLDFRPLSA